MLCPSCDAIRFPTDVLDSNNRTTTVATTVIEKSRKPGKAGRTNSSKTEQSANHDVEPRLVVDVKHLVNL